MEQNEKKVTRIMWSIREDNTGMSVKFPDATEVEFLFTNIKDYDKDCGKGIVHGLFVHGLKQKLADSVAGATKAGVSFTDQAKTMQEKWEDIRTGVAKVRANAKIDPLAEARAKLEAMPDGKEKDQAMIFAKLLGIIK